ncbi:hypothetical protein ACMS1Z_15355 [Acidiphilium multivorum]|uniref:hypothetical protein n=1 Tax=Acidiphilium multivorum TaxID=62140 RepID=UPI0039C9308E
MSDEFAEHEGLPDEPQAAPEDWQARAMAAEQAMEALRREHAERLRRAELRIEAVRAGMIDLDGLRLIDPAALMAQLKRDKPWLFGAPSSSSTASVPRAEPPRARHATELSEAEWRAARAELLRRAGG